MIEFLVIFVGGFIVFLASVMFYRFLFDKERWNKSLDNARAAGAARKAKSEIKHQAMKERHDQIRAKSELKLQEIKERHAQKDADRKARAEEEQVAKIQMHERERELKAVMAERKQATPSVSRSVRGSNRRYREDPLIGGIIGGLAAASLGDDIKSAFIDGEFDDSGDSENCNLDDNDDGAMSSDDGEDW